MKNGQMLMNKMVALILALLAIGVGAFLLNKYVLGAGEDIGQLSKCDSQGGSCFPTKDQPGRTCYYKIMGCPDDGPGNDNYCCLPNP